MQVGRSLQACGHSDPMRAWARPLPFFKQHKFYIQIEILAGSPQAQGHGDTFGDTQVFTKWLGWIESKLRQLVKHMEQIP